jgi:three-Cys-motif partner protein
MISEAPWTGSAARKTRGVVFLDPYALSVEWATLQALAATKTLDVWYLFPLEAVTRVLSRDLSAIGNNASLLDRVLTPSWQDLYTVDIEPEAAPSDLFPIVQNQRQYGLPQAEK